MNDNVKITLSIKAPPDVGHCHTISDPGHSHGIVPAPADLIAEAHRQMMARKLMTVRPLPREQE